MMDKASKLLMLAILLNAVAAPAYAMRCGNKLVREGDHQAKVAGLCGEPAYKDQRSVYRYGIANPRLDVVSDQNFLLTRNELALHEGSVVEVPVEVWVFNYGPRRLMREVVFLDGRVLSLTTLGYGY